MGGNFFDCNPRVSSPLPLSRPFVTASGSHNLPTLKFNTWDFVNTRNGKSRKYVELPSLRSAALKYQKLIAVQISLILRGYEWENKVTCGGEGGLCTLSHGICQC